MKIIVIDRRENFLSDIETRLMLDDRDIELIDSASNSEKLNEMLDLQIKKGEIPDVLVIADNVAREQQDWHFPNCKTVGYITKKNGENPFIEKNIPYYDFTFTSELLLNRLSLGLPSNDYVPADSNQTVKQAETPIENSSRVFSSDVSRNATNDFIPQDIPVVQNPTANHQNNCQPPVASNPVQYTPLTAPSQRTPSDQPMQPQRPHYVQNGAPEQEFYNNKNDQQRLYPQTSSPSVKERLDQASRNEIYNTANSLMKNDLSRAKKETKVVTVYSAKGGVGKTSIATELAAYLSRTSVGRGYLRVCIIDCNIDFGDVQTTLDFDPSGKNMSYWSQEIKERLGNGEKAENISYSKSEIESHLQISPTGLYALIAPITHEDSMDIATEEMEIIFDNIIANGDFDFIVFDTGNNTRDSTVLALEKANEIFLVATQDVSTASCNSSFLKTMQKINFDTQKIKLIVNGIMPYKVTQVSVQEVEDRFKYKCIARIARTPDVIRANNCSQPIVLQDPNHPFTKEIKNVVSYLLGQEVPDISNKNKGLKKLFSKRK